VGITFGTQSAATVPAPTQLNPEAQSPLEAHGNAQR
jgi:hypothetical protein